MPEEKEKFFKLKKFLAEAEEEKQWRTVPSSTSCNSVGSGVSKHKTYSDYNAECNNEISNDYHKKYNIMPAGLIKQQYPSKNKNANKQNKFNSYEDDY